LFTDIDEGDTLTWSATRADGSDLPGWLRFDAASRQFTGTPALADAGRTSLRLVATDMEGAWAELLFDLTVNGLNTMTGTAGKDTLNGTAAMDLIDGLAGIDRMAGGRNDDIYRVDNARDVVVELPGEGRDRVEAIVAFTLPTEVEDITLLGAANLAATGNALANWLQGNDGNNRLDGLGGADTLAGGPGNDTYVLDNPGDTVLEAPGDGTDTVWSGLALFSLPDNVENLTLVGGWGQTGAGNGLNNVLRSANAGSRLHGMDGADTLFGGDGADTLTGGAGDDRLLGAGGRDELHGGLGNDRLEGGPEADLYRFGRGDGFDTVVENDATVGVLDMLRFGGGIDASQLWFRKIGQALQIDIIGTDDSVRLANWYSSSASQVEVFELADGQRLHAVNVPLLVAAMARLTEPAFGLTELPETDAARLIGVIDNVWV
jgi:Ca2+-binding RTX toxin-like protein